MKKNDIIGWNTWNTNNMLSHVLLPNGFEIFLGIKEYSSPDFLAEALMGRIGSAESPQRYDNSFEQIRPGAHSFDGTYTALSIIWKKIELNIQSAVFENNLYIFIEPGGIQKKIPLLIAGTGILWNNSGILKKEDNLLIGEFADEIIPVRSTKRDTPDLNVPCRTPYLSLKLDSALAVYTGGNMPLSKIIEIIERKRIEYEKEKLHFGNDSECFEIIRASQSWNMIYDPTRNCIISPVSRIWNAHWGGWVQHCWDTFFSGYMASIGNKQLAYSNITSMINNVSPDGFIPNCAAANGFKTLDRSQPPVGSFCVKEIYRKYREKEFILEVFDGLYEWNSWYYSTRRVSDNLLSWGSKIFEPVLNNYWESAGAGEIYGAAMESGMDNSPMYDNIPINPHTHCMELVDVGLMSLYIWDCQALMELATIIGKDSEYAQLENRKEKITEGLDTLWDDDFGLYLNKRIDTGEFSKRISPTNMYPLLTGVISKVRATRIINEHFYNEQEFYGKWILPSISKNDPAFNDQDYWRGRIWPPTNFLVYLGLRRYKFHNAQKDLAQKSQELVYKEWLEKGHLHENYNAISGEGCDVKNSDPFLNWGGLLVMISLIENEYIKAPENPL